MMIMWRLALFWAAVLLVGSAAVSRAAEVGLIHIDGAIGPATAGYIERAISVAGSRNDVCLIIQLDTPGGLLDSTKDIVQEFYQSRVPVVVFVAPSGANAASAGTFITMAADVAVMAPHTTIGAAHPVEAGGLGEQKMDEVMKTKMESYAGSYIQSIAEKRGRNVEWAKAAVVESKSATAEEALKLNVIDLIATNVPDLLQKLNGRDVDGHTLETADATVTPIKMIARERLFQLLWRPEVMFILMLAAIYGIIGEVSNPGAILPGVVGGISLILALYMAAILPINIAGVALIGVAILMFVADIFAPTHGVLTFGGIVSFFLGSLMLFDRAGPAFRLSMAYIIPATALTAAFFIFIVGAGLRAQWLPVRAGKETMLGKAVPAVARIDRASGKVFIEGEYWNAVSDTVIEPGQLIEIVAIKGLTLTVKPKEK